MTQPAIPEFLATYLEQRDNAHADAVNAFLSTLTDRELALMKDAAVMGYVRGRTHPQGEKHPKDSAVLIEVIDAAFAFPDLYPAINAHLADDEEPDTTEEPAPDCIHPEGYDSECPCPPSCFCCQPAPAVTEEPAVVAYHSYQGTTLLCRRHAPTSYLIRIGDMVPLTSEDLPDGGICTRRDCGRDVLATPATTEGSVR
ncbi:hypothetical protein [Streptomyces sp. NPDC018352]|uniref:hypothetical protein n=1 Tax=Streptomyces sp. NPDC018352 TaxID=3157194 RepID=UPI0033C927D7